MAKKDVEKYFRQVTQQNMEAQQDLSDMENSHDTLYPEEVAENIRVMAKSINETYQLLSWVMYLLNKPTKKSGLRAYEKHTQKMRNALDHNKTQVAVVKSNKEKLKLITEAKKHGRDS